MPLELKECPAVLIPVKEAFQEVKEEPPLINRQPTNPLPLMDKDLDQELLEEPAMVEPNKQPPMDPELVVNQDFQDQEPTEAPADQEIMPVDQEPMKAH